MLYKPRAPRPTDRSYEVVIQVLACYDRDYYFERKPPCLSRKVPAMNRTFSRMSVVLLTLLVSLRAAFAADANAPIRIENYLNKIRVACIGDSITAGVGAAGGSYPTQLGKRLGSKWEVRNFGVSGSTLLNRGDNPYQRQGALRRPWPTSPTW